jgi:3-hydroxy-5-methyl-1-naphthoate 3-O-methyltransferase
MLALFWEAMHSISTFIARAPAEAVGFGCPGRPLDIGGGLGAFGTELCRRYRHLWATACDLPFVAAFAAGKIAAAG